MFSKHPPHYHPSLTEAKPVLGDDITYMVSYGSDLRYHTVWTQNGLSPCANTFNACTFTVQVVKCEVFLYSEIFLFIPTPTILDVGE